MADDNIGALAFANTPEPTAPNLSGATQSGMQMGIELASKKAQIAIQQQDLQFKRQQLEQQKMEHMTGLMDKALGDPDPVVRQARMKQMLQVGNTIGYPVPQETLDAISKSDNLRNGIMATLPYRNLMNPEERSQLTQELMGAMMGGPIKVAEFLDKMTDQQSKLEQSKALAGGRVQAVKEAAHQKRISDLIPYVSSPEEAQVLNAGPSDPRFLDVFGKVSAIKSDREKTLAQVKVDTQQETARHNKSMESIDRLRVQLQKSKDSQGIVDKIMSDTKADRESLKEVTTVQSLLRPGATYNQVNMAAQGLERAMTHSARVSNSQYQGVKLTDVVAQFEQKLASWRIGKQEDAVVPEGIIKNYQDIAGFIQNSTANNVKASAAKYAQPAVRNGLIDKNGARDIIQNLSDPKKIDQFLGQIGYVEPAQSPGSLKVPDPSVVKSLMDKAKSAGSGADAVKAYLRKNGYDDSGVK